MPMLAAYQNFLCHVTMYDYLDGILQTFDAAFFSLYVRFVPVSDVLAIFVSDWRCEFSPNF